MIFDNILSMFASFMMFRILAKLNALLLSMYDVQSDWINIIEFYFTQHLLEPNQLLYSTECISASMVDCNFDFHVIVPQAAYTTYPVVDLLESG